MDEVEPSTDLQAAVHDAEEIQWVVRPHRLAQFVDECGTSLPRALFGAVVVGLTVYGVASVVAIPLGGGQWVVGSGLVAAVLTFVGRLWRPITRLLLGGPEYAATDRRLLKREGVVGGTLASVPLAGIKNTTCRVHGSEQLFDAGTVTVNTKRGYDRLRFPHTSNPEAFVRAVEDLEPTADPTEELEPTDAPDADPVPGVRASLADGETVQWTTRPDTVGRTVKWFVGVGFLYAILSPVVALPIFVGTLFVTGSLLVGLAVVLGVLVSIAAVPIGLDLLWTTQYAVTDRRVIVYTDRLGERVDSVPLARVRDAEHDSGAFASVLGIGRVTVDTDAEAERLTFDLVASPTRVAQRVTRAANAAGSPVE